MRSIFHYASALLTYIEFGFLSINSECHFGIWELGDMRKDEYYSSYTILYCYFSWCRRIFFSIPWWNEFHIRNRVSVSSLIIRKNDSYFAIVVIETLTVRLCISSQTYDSPKEYYYKCFHICDIKKILFVSHCSMTSISVTNRINVYWRMTTNNRLTFPEHL